MKTVLFVVMCIAITNCAVPRLWRTDDMDKAELHKLEKRDIQEVNVTDQAALNEIYHILNITEAFLANNSGIIPGINCTKDGTASICNVFPTANFTSTLVGNFCPNGKDRAADGSCVDVE